MDLNERTLEEALEHLRGARREMGKLMATSDDWTTVEMLKIEFDELEKAVRDFGRYQLGIRRR